MLAQAKGYYKAEGVDVEFAIGKGGADVAKQVGAGNADLGGGIGDTPVIVRPNGVPVKAVAVLGGRALTQIVVRADSGINGPADLKGKTVAVMAYQDTTYYSLLGALAAFNMTKNDVNAQAVGPAGVSKLMISGDAPAMAGVPEWAAAVEAEVSPSNGSPSISISRGWPRRSSPRTKPSQEAAGREGLRQGHTQGTGRNHEGPQAAAKEYVAAVPQHAGKEAAMAKILGYYAEKVYPGQKVLGAMDEVRLEKLQDFYVAQGIVRAKTPLAELYTNQFVQ